MEVGPTLKITMILHTMIHLCKKNKELYFFQSQMYIIYSFNLKKKTNKTAFFVLLHLKIL